MIEKIIETEWRMFNCVANIGERAECQNDKWTFYVMRYSCLYFLSEETLKSYFGDLNRAKCENRNLIEEKYAYMMIDTDPKYFEESLKQFLPVITEKKNGLVEGIVKILLKDEQRFRNKFPGIVDKGRPLLETRELVSFLTYLNGELKTYSEETLEKYLADIKNILQCGKSPSVLIYSKIAMFYGYDDIAEMF